MINVKNAVSFKCNNKQCLISYYFNQQSSGGSTHFHISITYSWTSSYTVHTLSARNTQTSKNVTTGNCLLRLLWDCGVLICQIIYSTTSLHTRVSLFSIPTRVLAWRLRHRISICGRIKGNFSSPKHGESLWVPASISFMDIGFFFLEGRRSWHEASVKTDWSFVSTFSYAVDLRVIQRSNNFVVTLRIRVCSS